MGTASLPEKQNRLVARCGTWLQALCWLLCTGNSAFAQQNNFNQDLSNSIKFFDAAGKPFVNPNVDYKGSPYLLDNWSRGVVTLANDTAYVNNYTKLNLETGEVLFLNDRHQEMLLTSAKIKSFVLTDSTQSPPVVYYFRNGFPAITGHGPDFLYRACTQGKLLLLEAVEKKLQVDRNAFSGETAKEYQTIRFYYLFSGVVLKQLPRDKAGLLSWMKDKQPEMELFLQANPTRFKEITDITRMIDYYNKLVIAKP